MLWIPAIRGLICTLAVFLACAATAHARRAPLFGFSDNAGLYAQVSPDAAAAAAAGAGATSVRLTIDWRTVEPTRGKRDFARYDQLYAAALAHGQKPLLVVAFAPPWARSLTACLLSSDCTAPPAPSHVGDFAAFAAEAARRYPEAAGIEVWNEPNLRLFWGGQPVDPARYAQLLKTTYAAVKAVAPAMPVITGGLSPYGGGDRTGPGMGVREWLVGMYAAGAKGAYDGVGMHAYTGYDLWYGFRAMTLVREALAEHGDGAKLWLTEAGISTTGPRAVAPDDQARYLGRVIPRLRSRPDVAGVWVHTLYETTGAHTDRGFGVLDAAGAPKPAYCVLAAIFATRICATPAPDPVQRARWRAGSSLQVAVDDAIRRHAARGTYSGLTSSATVIRAAGDRLLLCSTIKADRTYCIRSERPGDWTYGATTGDAAATAQAIDAGRSASW